MIQKYLLLQSKSPYVDDYDDFLDSDIHIATLKDLELILPFIERDLHKNGYKKPSNEEFIEKVKFIFNVDLSSYSTDKIVTLMGVNQRFSSKEEAIHQYHFDSGYLFASLKYKCVFYSTFLKDYISWDNNDGLVYQNPPIGITALNKYLFNESKASFRQLVSFSTYAENKGFLLRKLFYDFQYFKDQTLNKWIFQDALNDVINMNPLTFKPISYVFQKRNNNLVINSDLLYTIENNTTSQNTVIFDLFGLYIYKIFSSEITNNYTQEEKVDIFCAFANLEYDIREKYLTPESLEYWTKQPYTYIIDSNHPELLKREETTLSKKLLDKIESLKQEGREAR